jgi:sugar phosphate isomerase/epimerase
MHQISRRGFLAGSITLAGRAALSAPAAPGTRIKMCLNTGNIGVRATLAESISMAARCGFDAVDPNPKELAALSDSAMRATLDDLASRTLTFGSASMAFPIGQGDDAWAAFLKEMAATAKTLERAHMKRFFTWLSSSDATLTYLQNFRLHARRLGEASAILNDFGITLGLEYLGPKTLWARSKYPFVHTMATMKELIAEIHRPNVGIVLDIWHWYTAGDTVADVLTLKNQDLVAVHMSDAPAGIPVGEQIDNRRELPMATGVIDTAGFLNALNQVGYDGPAVAEPFNAELRSLPPEQALAKTAESMKRAFALIKP